MALLGRCALLTLAASSIVAVLLIVAFIVREAWPFFAQRGIAEALGSKDWTPEGRPPHFGMLAGVYGSAIVTVTSLLLAVPVGLLTALVLSDIVPFRVQQTVKPVLELLAAIPSVAYGFFAILVMAPWLHHDIGLTTGANALNCSIILAVMAIPTIVSVAEDSLTAVGRDLREASYACGATRAETLLKVVVPAAHNGLMAAVVLGMMRAIGETMLVWMASGNATQIPAPWWDLTQSIRTMTGTIAGELGESAAGSLHRQALFAVALLLLVISFAMNLATEMLLRRARLRAGGSK